MNQLALYFIHPNILAEIQTYAIISKLSYL